MEVLPEDIQDDITSSSQQVTSTPESSDVDDYITGSEQDGSSESTDKEETMTAPFVTKSVRVSKKPKKLNL